MGKYMRKSKTTGEVSVMEMSHHHHHHTQKSSSPLGVRTRAKTLALQRLKKSTNSSTAGTDGGGGSYLQLRSRRLEKPKPTHVVKRQKHPFKDPNLPNPVCSRTNSGSLRKALEEEKTHSSCGGVAVEASFGENFLEFDARERTTRESTPCSLIRDSDNIQPPGSSTRPTVASEANNRVPNSSRRRIPTAPEMNDFFAGAEEHQQKQFIEKYNFDPVNEKPLPGRYEWVKVDR